jgi:hypothetical protein
VRVRGGGDGGHVGTWEQHGGATSAWTQGHGCGGGTATAEPAALHRCIGGEREERKEEEKV